MLQMSDYNGYQYPNKDRRVKIFKIIKKRYPQDPHNEVIVKEYLHPAAKSLCAYVRQLVSKEEFTSEAHKDSSNYLVVINFREGIDLDCYVEFKDKTMKAVGVDGYEQRDLELKITCQVITDDLEFNETRDREWKL